MANDNDILIRISGQTHRLQPDKPETFKKIPWAQRKRLIEVLEAVKKAEYLDSTQNQRPDPQSVVQDKGQVNSKLSQTQNNPPNSKNVDKTGSPADSDALLQRFLAEQQNHKKELPTKTVIYKWFFIVFAIILLLVLLT